ncbi:MAG TPA: ATP-dependent DNA helicase, partial [Candidatus Acidoferrales bacterium]|nr:ATP-dependent DNA helicase [Candidatus Acidoferrales bacterium]
MLDLFPPTDQQLAVIRQRGENLLVLAGPGTGKTETLARRFASLVADGIEAHQILVLTFSRRAADEMRDRILLRLRQLRGKGLAVSELFVKTFHSFCGRLLEGEQSRTHERKLLTPVKERLLWHRLVRDAGFSLESVDRGVAESAQFATDCLNVIAQLKGRGVSADRVTALAGDDRRLRDLARLYERMEAQRTALDLADYRDLVNEAERALRDGASAASAWLRAAGFRHVLVDEFQDSDRMQLELLAAMRAAIQPEPCFCFVGDKNQSIYRFRGASPGNVDLARDRFACVTLELHDNRRSAQAVLDVANADQALDAASKTHAADRTKAGAVRFERPRTVEDEVRCVKDAVVRRISAGTAPGAIAVLLRQTQPYQELIIAALREAGVPVAAQPTAGFHTDGLVDAMLTALRLLAQPQDLGLWQRLLINPIVGYRPIDVRFAFDSGRRKGDADPLSMLEKNPPQGVRAMRAFLGAWRRCQAAYERDGPGQLARTVAFELDLLRPVRETRPVEGFDPHASPARLSALLEAAADYEELGSAAASSAGNGSLKGRLAPNACSAFVANLDETISLLADASQPPYAGQDGVRVISIHAAKGLEFDFVAVPDAIEGTLPASVRPNRLLPEKSIEALRRGEVDIFVDDDAARTEERSLWYVALTRAREEVLVTAALVDEDAVELQASSYTRGLTAADRQGATIEGASRETAREGALFQAPRTAASSTSAGASAADPMLFDIQQAEQTPPGIVVPIAALSPTSINRFVGCPRQFYYADVLRLPSHSDEATRYGQMLHQLLARLHERETDFESGDARTIVDRCRSALREILPATGPEGEGPLDRYEREDLARKLDEYVQRMADEAARSPFRVLGCELPVRSSLENLTIHGKVDRVDRLRSGGLLIRDYKSGRRYAPTVEAVRQALGRIDDDTQLFGNAPRGLNLQTLLYIPGVEAMFGAKVEAVEYIFFRGKSADESEILFERTRIVDAEHAGDADALARSDVERVRHDIAARIARLCSDGSM